MPPNSYQKRAAPLQSFVKKAQPSISPAMNGSLSFQNPFVPGKMYNSGFPVDPTESQVLFLQRNFKNYNPFVKVGLR